MSQIKLITSHLDIHNVLSIDQPPTNMPKTPQAWQRLAWTNRHPRDERIEFDEPTHKYTIDSANERWISCTGFIHDFFPHFDPVAAVKAIKRGKNYAMSKYYGKTDQEILDGWSNSGKEASGLGTAMHLAIEQFMNGAHDLIEEPVKQTKEWQFFTNFWNDCGPDLVPYRMEWEVFSLEHKLAGSIDAIFYRPSDGKYVIYDYEKGYCPLDHLPNCNYWHYSLQLNIYKWFLETFYGLEIADLYLIILHPDNKNYHRLRLNFLPDEVQAMLNCRLRALQTGAKTGIVLPAAGGWSEGGCAAVEDD